MIKIAKIEGWQELARVLRGLPDGLAKNALRSAALAGAKKLQDAAYVELNAAVKSGGPRHADDVIVKQRRAPKGEVQAHYDVGPPSRKPWLRWLHDGTKPHEIVLRRSKMLSDGEKVYGTIVKHPGQPPIPWLKQAQFLSAGAVYQAMADSLRRALPRQVKKLVSSAYRSKQLKRIFS